MFLPLPWEGCATELSLNEELAVEDFGSGIERSAGDRGVYVVCGSNRVAIHVHIISVT